MHIYNHLSEEVQKTFLIRFCFCITLIMMSAYCIIVTAIFHNTYWLIGAIVINTIECLNIVNMMWYLVEHNTVPEDSVTYGLDCVIFLSYTALTTIYWLIHYFQLYELAYVVFCSVFIYGCIIIYIGCVFKIIIVAVWSQCHERIHKTMFNVKERQMLYTPIDENDQNENLKL